MVEARSDTGMVTNRVPRGSVFKLFVLRFAGDLARKLQPPGVFSVKEVTAVRFCGQHVLSRDIVSVFN